MQRKVCESGPFCVFDFESFDVAGIERGTNSLRTGWTGRMPRVSARARTRKRSPFGGLVAEAVRDPHLGRCLPLADLAAVTRRRPAWGGLRRPRRDGRRRGAHCDQSPAGRKPAGIIEGDGGGRSRGRCGRIAAGAGRRALRPLRRRYPYRQARSPVDAGGGPLSSRPGWDLRPFSEPDHPPTPRGAVGWSGSVQGLRQPGRDGSGSEPDQMA
jgi:hypothetical protein